MKHRLFVAIDVPSAEILALQLRLDQLRLPVIWEKPEKIHLTLNFLGRIPDDQFSQINGIIRNIAKKFPPQHLELHFLETLYRRHESTLVYLSASSPDLKSLQHSLSLSLSPISPQPIRFLPHITIGQLKRTDPTTTKRVIDQISNFDYTPLPSFAVDHITLYESFLSSKGSTYQKQATFSLSSLSELT
ncbi:MAG: 2'-5' RNA ligase [Microgenomates group bacterium Gr01-1014_16]|nr:MAG: 2'-5' RNA ligase [Microgenomates group bacterium Gr01-1014_16]